MRKREVIAWFLVIFNAVAASLLGWQLRVSKAEKLESAALMFECAEKVEELSEACTEESLEYMKRGNLLFECQQEICKVNGWSKPFDFDESLREMGRVEAYNKEDHE